MNAVTSDSGPLSVEEAVELLDARDEPVAQEAAAEAETEPDEDTEGQTSDAEDAPEEASDESDDGEQDEPETGIDPPAFWNAEAREIWAKLPAEAQKVVLEREQQRDAATSKAIEAAALERKSFEAKAAQVSEFTSHLNATLEQANHVFQDRWAGVDWTDLARTDPTTYVQLKAEHEADLADMAQLQRAKTQADQIARQHTMEQEQARLAQIAPELAQSAEERGKVAQFLLGQGIPTDVLQDITAAEMAIAYDAYRYRQLKAKGFTPKASAPAKVEGQKAVKPSAAPTRVSPQSQRQQALAAKKVWTVDDAVAAMS